MALIDRIQGIYPKPLFYERLMDRMPTKLGQVEDVVLYEHPVYGDEAGIIAVHHLRRIAVQTDIMDVEDFNDF